MSPTYYVYPGLTDLKVNRQSFETKKLLTVKKIVTEYFKMHESLIAAKIRRQDIADARKIYCYLCKTVLHIRIDAIGLFINRDHSTVCVAAARCSELMEVDEEFAKDVFNLSSKVLW